MKYCLPCKLIHKEFITQCSKCGKSLTSTIAPPKGVILKVPIKQYHYTDLQPEI